MFEQHLSLSISSELYFDGSTKRRILSHNKILTQNHKCLPPQITQLDQADRTTYTLFIDCLSNFCLSYEAKHWEEVITRYSKIDFAFFKSSIIWINSVQIQIEKLQKKQFQDFDSYLTILNQNFSTIKFQFNFEQDFNHTITQLNQLNLNSKFIIRKIRRGEKFKKKSMVTLTKFATHITELENWKEKKYYLNDLANDLDTLLILLEEYGSTTHSTQSLPQFNEEKLSRIVKIIQIIVFKLIVSTNTWIESDEIKPKERVKVLNLKSINLIIEKMGAYYSSKIVKLSQQFDAEYTLNDSLAIFDSHVIKTVSPSQRKDKLKFEKINFLFMFFVSLLDQLKIKHKLPPLFTNLLTTL